jgi:hypothetical protein
MFGELPAYGFYVRHVNGISMKNIKLTLDNPDFRPAFVFDDVKGIEMEEITVPKKQKGQIILKNSKEIGLDADSNLMLNTVN